MLNARLLGDKDINIFKGLFENWIFIFILVLTIVVQITMVNYGGKAVRCAQLNTSQNLMCTYIGAGSLLWGMIVKFVLPSFLFDFLTYHEDAVCMDDEEERGSLVASLRLSQRQKTIK